MIYNIMTDVEFYGYSIQNMHSSLFWKGGIFQHSILLTSNLQQASLILDLEAARTTARDLSAATGHQFSVVEIRREDATPPEDFAP